MNSNLPQFSSPNTSPISRGVEPQSLFPDSEQDIEETTVNFGTLEPTSQVKPNYPTSPSMSSLGKSSQPSSQSFNLFGGLGQTMNMESFAQSTFSTVGMQVIGKSSSVVNDKNWKRRISKDSAKEIPLPPQEDINAPDFYIPTMSFVTWVLIIGLFFGTANQFTPEVLGMIASSGVIGMVIEILAIKFALYLFTNSGLSILDLISYCGYKYVGIALSSFLGFIMGYYTFYSCLLITSIFHSFFLFKTLNAILDTSDITGDQPSKTLRYILLAIAAENILHSLILSSLQLK